MTIIQKFINKIKNFKHEKKSSDNQKDLKHLEVLEEIKIEIIPAVNKDEDKEIAENITRSSRRGDSLQFQDDINNDIWLNGQ